MVGPAQAASGPEVWGQVELRALCQEPGRFSFSWPVPGDGLEESLARHGQLHPLLVADEGEGGLLLLAGHRRARALEAQGRDKAWARVVEPGRDAGHLWDLLLEEHLASRPLNPAEVGLYALRRFAATGETPESLCPAVFGRLGLPARPAALEDPLWVAELPARHRDGFAAGRLPLAVARGLAAAPREDALAVLDLLAGAAVGVNKAVELGRWALECAWREGLPVAAWAAREGLDALAGAPERLRPELRRRRYPELTVWEEDFRADLRAVALPAGAHLAHPPGFEGGRLTCTLPFGRLEELEKGLRGLLELLRAGGLERLRRYLG